MTSSNLQKVRKHQCIKSEKQLKRDSKIAIRKAKRNRRNVWIIKGEM